MAVHARNIPQLRALYNNSTAQDRSCRAYFSIKVVLSRLSLLMVSS
jgi:hypothetical protein